MNIKAFLCFKYLRLRLGVGVIAALLLFGSEARSVTNEPEFNRRATATAQLLAGITPNPPEPAFNKFLELDVWKEHQKWMSSQWAQVRGRLNVMENWRDHEIKIAGAQKKTMVYPFSGPDFINAYALFPDHSRYVFFSLERPGSLPDMESVTPGQFVKLLTDVRSAFRDIFERNYFITSYMSKQLTTPWVRGAVPVMATMMALMNRRIVRIEPLDLFPELTKAYDTLDGKRPRMLLRGVRIDFANPATAGAQQLYYFSLDATDKALEYYPDFLNWVGQHKPSTALLKSASYLLHDEQFAKTRAMVLESSDILVQDDTGIPYRYLNQTPWQVKLYGKYQKPIRPMGYAYQKDLDTAFKDKTATADLPFPFGYHWRGSQSGLILANKERSSN
ncbi:MAG: hypothetical protein HW419_2450 [Deltaproteobacteria bacterium]|nr:hypothetical protein [Deltaproteobacteria bacterium]